MNLSPRNLQLALFLVLALAVSGSVLAGPSDTPNGSLAVEPVGSLVADSPEEDATQTGSLSATSEVNFLGQESEPILSRAQPCGACSASPCVDSFVGNICGYSGGQFYRCQNYLGTMCGGGGWDCRCSTAFIP